MTEELKQPGSEKSLVKADRVPVHVSSLLNDAVQRSLGRRPLIEAALTIAKGFPFRVNPEVLALMKSPTAPPNPTQRIVSQDRSTVRESETAERPKNIKPSQLGVESDHGVSEEFLAEDPSLIKQPTYSNKYRLDEWRACSIEEQQRRHSLMSRVEDYRITMRYLIDGKTSPIDRDATYAYFWERYNEW